MTDEELVLLNKIASCWNEYLALPRQHPDELNEFRTKVHELQIMIMARPTERELEWKKDQIVK